MKKDKETPVLVAMRDPYLTAPLLDLEVAPRRLAGQVGRVAGEGAPQPVGHTHPKVPMPDADGHRAVGPHREIGGAHPLPPPARVALQDEVQRTPCEVRNDLARVQHVLADRVEGPDRGRRIAPARR